MHVLPIQSVASSRSPFQFSDKGSNEGTEIWPLLTLLDCAVHKNMHCLLPYLGDAYKLTVSGSAHVHH